MNKILKSAWLYRIVRFALGAVFVYAGLVKLVDPKAFARVISQYDLVPEFLLAPVAIGLPIVELLAGLGLLLNIRGSLAVIFGLLVMFITVLGYGIMADLNIDCGCLSAAEIEGIHSLKQAFYRDLVMIAAVLYLFLSRRLNPKLALSSISQFYNKS